MMSSYRSSAFLLLVLLCGFDPALSAAEELLSELGDEVISQKSEIRKIGYNVGDIAQQKIVVITPAGYRLDENSLPVMGKGSGQFELRETRINTRAVGSTTHHEFIFDWQIFQVLPEVKPYSLMPLDLQFRHGDRLLAAHIEAPSVMVSSFLPLVMKSDDIVLQADIAAAPRSIRGLEYALILTIGTMLLSIAYFGWYFDWLRLGWHTPRPFRQACRQIRGIQNTASPIQQSLIAMRFLRRAFDAAAGTSLSIESLDLLFEHKPQLIALRSEIESFYAESERAFFSGERQVSEVKHLGKFGRRLRAIETA